MMSKSISLMGIVWLFAYTVAYAQATVHGTPYMDDAFVQGEIYYGNTIHKVPVRYNIFQDLMEYKENGQTLLLDANTSIKKVHFGTNMFVVEKFEFKRKTKYGFLALLDSGKVMLFSKKVVNYLGAQKGRALDGGDEPARYTRSADVFYYKVGDGDVLEVGNVKSMIASFPGKQEELTLFAKKEKISARREEELIQLVQYYNSL
jgi:hypothetical protein